MGTRRCAVAIAAVVAVSAALAPAAQAGSVRVPLDRADPGLGHIRVRYAVLRHTDRTRPPLEPVVAFEGGPATGRSARRARTSSCSGSSTAATT